MIKYPKVCTGIIEHTQPMMEHMELIKESMEPNRTHFKPKMHKSVVDVMGSLKVNTPEGFMIQTIFSNN